MGRMWYSSIPYALVYNERELIQLESGYILYVLIYNERELIWMLGKFNTIWYKHGVDLSNWEWTL